MLEAIDSWNLQYYVCRIVLRKEKNNWTDLVHIYINGFFCQSRLSTVFFLEQNVTSEISFDDVEGQTPEQGTSTCLNPESDRQLFSKYKLCLSFAAC